MISNEGARTQRDAFFFERVSAIDDDRRTAHRLRPAGNPPYIGAEIPGRRRGAASSFANNYILLLLMWAALTFMRPIEATTIPRSCPEYPWKPEFGVLSDTTEFAPFKRCYEYLGHQGCHNQNMCCWDSAAAKCVPSNMEQIECQNLLTKAACGGLASPDICWWDETQGYCRRRCPATLNAEAHCSAVVAQLSTQYPTRQPTSLTPTSLSPTTPTRTPSKAPRIPTTRPSQAPYPLEYENPPPLNRTRAPTATSIPTPVLSQLYLVQSMCRSDRDCQGFPRFVCFTKERAPGAMKLLWLKLRSFYANATDVDVAEEDVTEPFIDPPDVGVCGCNRLLGRDGGQCTEPHGTMYLDAIMVLLGLIPLFTLAGIGISDWCKLCSDMAFSSARSQALVTHVLGCSLGCLWKVIELSMLGDGSASISDLLGPEDIFLIFKLLTFALFTAAALNTLAMISMEVFNTRPTRSYFGSKARFAGDAILHLKHEDRKNHAMRSGGDEDYAPATCATHVAFLPAVFAGVLSCVYPWLAAHFVLMTYFLVCIAFASREIKKARVALEIYEVSRFELQRAIKYCAILVAFSCLGFIFVAGSLAGTWGVSTAWSVDPSFAARGPYFAYRLAELWAVAGEVCLFASVHRASKTNVWEV